MVNPQAWVAVGMCTGLGFPAILHDRARALFPSLALPAVWLIAILAFSLTMPTEPMPYFHARGALGWGVLTNSGLWLPV